MCAVGGAEGGADVPQLRPGDGGPLCSGRLGGRRPGRRARGPAAGRRPVLPGAVRGPGGGAGVRGGRRAGPRRGGGGRGRAGVPWHGPRQLRPALARRPAPDALARGDRPARAPRRRAHRRPGRGSPRPGRVAGLLRGGRRCPPRGVPSRGWDDEEWGAARGRLQERGLLAADGTATEAGRELRAKVELRTDEEAAAPWRALGEEGRNRLVELLGEPWLEVVGSGMLPGENTLGIGKV